MLIDVNFPITTSIGRSPLKRIDKGLYLSCSYLTPLLFSKAGWEDNFLLYPELRDESADERLKKLHKMYKDNTFFSAYGSCDSISQFITTDTFKVIDKSKWELAITFNNLERIAHPGYRWHKNGPYLGHHTPKYEYFGDEDIDKIYQFHVYRKLT